MNNSVSSRESRANDVLTSLKFVTHDISSKNNPSKKKSSMLQLTEWTVHLKENSRNRQLMDTTAHRYSSTVIESEKKIHNNY